MKIAMKILLQFKNSGSFLSTIHFTYLINKYLSIYLVMYPGIWNVMNWKLKISKMNWPNSYLQPTEYVLLWSVKIFHQEYNNNYNINDHANNFTIPQLIMARIFLQLLLQMGVEMNLHSMALFLFKYNTRFSIQWTSI